MNVFLDIEQVRNTPGRTELLLSTQERKVSEYLARTGSRQAELVIPDPRRISTEQRKKIYACVRDISAYTGYIPEEMKEVLKYLYVERTGKPYFSLSDCSMETANQFLNIILDYALQEGVQLGESGLERTTDIYAYLVSCIIHRKCCICGQRADIHHIDAIGMGRDRTGYDDSAHEIIALCRKHHNIAHNTGRESFFTMYHVFGILKAEVEQRYQGIFL